MSISTSIAATLVPTNWYLLLCIIPEISATAADDATSKQACNDFFEHIKQRAVRRVYIKVYKYVKTNRKPNIEPVKPLISLVPIKCTIGSIGYLLH